MQVERRREQTLVRCTRTIDCRAQLDTVAGPSIRDLIDQVISRRPIESRSPMRTFD